ncbi:hypothetical protein QBC37DRAFT_400676 [Rhypophila decipiens]|uniref:Uncharacterized protein n=1 Tax=Rhypophila decipiens TaxID=261697 RepID=A0AAN6Y6T1_9PEZI|nr:hypothetical protein QBC37DRAFT_400676 [Rhypophila decipiens]
MNNKDGLGPSLNKRQGTTTPKVAHKAPASAQHAGAFLLLGNRVHRHAIAAAERGEIGTRISERGSLGLESRGLVKAVVLSLGTVEGSGSQCRETGDVQVLDLVTKLGRLNMLVLVVQIGLGIIVLVASSVEVDDCAGGSKNLIDLIGASAKRYPSFPRSHRATTPSSPTNRLLASLSDGPVLSKSERKTISKLARVDDVKTLLFSAAADPKAEDASTKVVVSILRNHEDISETWEKLEKAKGTLDRTFRRALLEPHSTRSSRPRMPAPR